MKYCIGCTHLDFTAPDAGQCGSTWTGVYGDTKGGFACQKRHWDVHFDEETKLFDIERAMRTAEKCPDYNERSIEASIVVTL